MSQPDPGPSPAARDVRHELAKVARQYREAHGRDASGPELVLLLARKYCPARLRRGER